MSRPISMTLHTLLTIDARQFEDTPLIGRALLIRDLAFQEAAAALRTMGQNLDYVAFGLGKYQIFAPSQALALWGMHGYAVRADVAIEVRDTLVKAA